VSRFWILRSPLLLVAAVAAVLGLAIGVASGVNTWRTHQQDERFQTWSKQADASTQAKLPILIRTFSAVQLPRGFDLRGQPPTRIPGSFSASVGPWLTPTSVQVTATGSVAALRQAGFTKVTAVESSEGWKVTGSTASGKVILYVRPSRNSASASRVQGLLEPAIQHCC
jgi:hypothetical protein